MKKNLIIVMIAVIGLSLGCKYLNVAEKTNPNGVSEKTNPKEAIEKALKNMKEKPFFKAKVIRNKPDTGIYDSSEIEYLAPDKGRLTVKMENDDRTKEKVIYGGECFSGTILGNGSRVAKLMEAVKKLDDFWQFQTQCSNESMKISDELKRMIPKAITPPENYVFVGKETISGKSTLKFKHNDDIDGMEISIDTDSGLPLTIKTTGKGFGYQLNFTFDYEQQPKIEKPNQ
jgi:hypothetical protein